MRNIAVLKCLVIGVVKKLQSNKVKSIKKIIFVVENVRENGTQKIFLKGMSLKT